MKEKRRILLCTILLLLLFLSSEARTHEFHSHHHGSTAMTTESGGGSVEDISNDMLVLSLEVVRFPPQAELLTVDKPFNVAISLDAYPLIASGSFRYYVSRVVGIDISIHSVLAILSYKAEGFSMGMRYLLNPSRSFSPFLYGCAGPLWKTENSNRELAGSIFSARFGWNYISDAGTNIYFSLGPTVLVVSGEKTMFPFIQVGVGINF